MAGRFSSRRLQVLILGLLSLALLRPTFVAAPKKDVVKSPLQGVHPAVIAAAVVIAAPIAAHALDGAVDPRIVIIGDDYDASPEPRGEFSWQEDLQFLGVMVGGVALLVVIQFFLMNNGY